MNFKDFQDINLSIWHQYFLHLSGGIKTSKEHVILYPNTIIFTETNSHFIAEFFGADQEYTTLERKENKEISTEKYFYQFTVSKNQEGKSALIVGDYLVLKGIRIAINHYEEKIKERFPHFNFSSFCTGGLNFNNPDIIKIPFSFTDTFKISLMSNFLLINTKEDFYRFKLISNLAITNKNISQLHYEEYLKQQLQNSLLEKPFHPFGIISCKQEEIEKRIISNQFANIYLSDFKETTIGNFLNKHPEIIKNAFDCEDFLYEKNLKWQEGNLYPEEISIKPDLFIKRKDGVFDICDLKLPFLEDKKITKGKHKRRGFKSGIEDGINQLANYNDYFNFQKNKDYAFKEYGINISDSSVLYLVVGNFENTVSKEVEEAMRKLNTQREKFRIIDYDSLNAMYLFKT